MRRMKRPILPYLSCAAGLTLASACVDSAQILEAIDESDAGGAGGAGGTGGTVASGGELNLGGATGGFTAGPSGTEVRVEGGDVHTCAVVDGTLYCWGDNQNGALGLGDFESRAVPTRVGTESDWGLVGSGAALTCALRVGIVYCWGAGSSGQLGNGEFSGSLSPQEVSLPAPARDLSVGHDHVCAILTDGRLFCWGNNTEGQLAQNDPFTGPGINSPVPLQVGTGADWGSVSCGQGHTCAIRTDGSLWCWGRNSLSELGLGEGAPGQIRVPQVVGADTDWEMVAVGQSHTCGIRGDDVYCWGANGHSQSGIVGQDPIHEPTQLVGHSGVVEVGVDTFHSCARTQDGGLSCWGRNIEGQLGDGTLEAEPLGTTAVPPDGWDQISVARFHTCGIRGGVILCTGENRDGRLGTGDMQRRSQYTETVF